MQRTTCSSKRHATQHKQRAACTDNMWTFDDQAQRTMFTAHGMQRATDTMQDAQDFLQHALCSGRNSKQQIACNVHQATCTKQRAACNSYRAEKSNQRATCRMKQPTDSRRRATDSRRHGKRTRAACLHMRVATANTRHCRISCAASSGQREPSSMREALYSTTSAQHGTDATQDATYDPCRSMQKTQMKRHGVRRTKSGSSRTSGLCQLPPYHRAGELHPTPRSPMSQTRNTK
jgi:hypothetical protein